MTAGPGNQLSSSQIDLARTLPFSGDRIASGARASGYLRSIVGVSEPVASQQTGEVLEDDAGLLAQEPTDFLAEVG